MSQLRTLPISYSHLGLFACALDVGLLIILGNLTSLVCHYLQAEEIGRQKFFSFVSFSCAVVYALIMQGRHLYRPDAILKRKGAVEAVATTWIMTASGLLAIAFVAKVSAEISRSAAVALFVEGLLLLPVLRLWESRVLERSIAHRGLRQHRRVVLLGDLDQLQRWRIGAKLIRYGYVVVRQFGCTTEREPDDQSAGCTLQTALAALRNYVRTERVDEVLLAFDMRAYETTAAAMELLRSLPLPVKMLFDERMNEIAALEIEDLGATRALQLQRGPLSRRQQAAKRFFDIIVASFGLVLLAPLLASIAVAVKLDSPGPVFFRQRRSGFSGRTFRIYKFRSMHTVEDDAEVRQATRFDSRVTRIGRFIRGTSIDELPQLFNVLRGEMSIVGPRPHAISHDDEYSEAIATYALRHHMKPGITGWAQANGYRGETPVLGLMEARVRHDLWYIANWSMMLDIRAVMLTVIRVICPKNVY